MKALQAKNTAKQMSIEEVNEVIADLEKEKVDREFEDAFNTEREQRMAKIMQEKPEMANQRISNPLRVHFKRPPKTTDEAIETLRQVDQRYE